MGNSANSSAGCGIELLGLLVAVFVAMKPCHAIDWSWRLCLRLWAELPFALLFCMLVGLVWVLKAIKRRK